MNYRLKSTGQIVVDVSVPLGSKNMRNKYQTPTGYRDVFVPFNSYHHRVPGARRGHTQRVRIENLEKLSGATA